VASGVADLARQTGTSVSVVLVAAYQAFLRHMTDVTDIVVPVLASDRRPERLRHAVGSLVDLTALRTDVAGCETFRRQVLRTRASCLAAHRHRLPYAEVLGECPHVARAYTEDDRAVFTFQVTGSPYAMRGARVGGLEYTAIRRLRSQDVGPDVPDGALWTLDVDPAGDITGSVRYATGLFARATVEELAAEFRQVLTRTVTAPDARHTDTGR
jgi:non-ribosomal peptide synthetase component F